MFNRGIENIGGRERGEQIKNASEVMTSAFESCCDGGLDKRLENSQDTNN